VDDTPFYIELISGQRHGAWAALQRGVLRTLSLVYGRVVAVRNRYYDRWSLPKWLGVPVISVGNLTVGGTGKTPLALWVCQRLLDRGRKPAVLSRGYKASQEGLSDELMMISRRYPDAVAIANPNRFAAGQLAIEQYGIEAVVLDDGFQHRRLGRDLDVVLIDAARPFGFGYILPRGLLREPVRGLARADAVVITRADQCTPTALDEIAGVVRQFNAQAPIVHAVHRPVGFTDLDGRPATAPAGGRVGCLAGIARPEAFVSTLNNMGHSPAETRWWPDHHVYGPNDVETIRRWVEETRLDTVITTEKDAVKLARVAADWPVPVLALRVEIEILEDGGKILSDLIDTVLHEYEEPENVETTEDTDEPDTPGE